MTQLAKQQNLFKDKRYINISKIDSDILQAPFNTTFSDLSRMAARQIAESITSNIRSQKQEDC